MSSVARFPLSNRSLNHGDYSVGLQIVCGGTASTAGATMEDLSCYTMRVEKRCGVVRSPVCGWGPKAGTESEEDVFQTAARLAKVECGVDVDGWKDRLCTLLQAAYVTHAPCLKVSLYDRGYGGGRGAKGVPEVSILVMLDPGTVEGAALLAPLVDKEVGCTQPWLVHGASRTHDLRWITVRELFQHKVAGSVHTWTVRGDTWWWLTLLPSDDRLELAPAEGGSCWQVRSEVRFKKNGWLAVEDETSAASLKDWLLMQGFVGGRYATMSDLATFCAEKPHSSQRLKLQPPSMVCARYPAMLEWNPLEGGGSKQHLVL